MLRRTLFPVLLVSASTVVSVAQQQAKVVATTAKDSDIPEVIARYDEREDQTTVSLSMKIFLERPDGINRLDINTHFSHPSRRLLIPPETVYFVLSVPCAQGEQLNRDDPVICADEECRSYSPRAKGWCEGGISRERTSRMIDLPREEFQRIANGYKVKIKIGENEIGLSESQVKTLKSLAERMMP
ncbi:MAG: hypothetical protein H0U81_00095 [Pyrinomonadaceae bacterium]|nr:hypothetical protein [Pyrinomonadaceae bacterium]